MKKELIIIAAASALLMLGVPAQAQRGGAGTVDGGNTSGKGQGYGRGGGQGYGRGGGQGKGRGYGHRGHHRGCGHRGQGAGRGLMSQPEAFKASLGLTDAQVTKIQAIHKNMVTKRTTHRAALQKVQQQRASERQADMPGEAKVMRLMRKGRALRGKMAEEHTKARLRILKVLTQEQRTKYRAACPNGGQGAVGATGRSGRRGGCGGGMYHGGRGMGQGR